MLELAEMLQNRLKMAYFGRMIAQIKQSPVNNSVTFLFSYISLILRMAFKEGCMNLYPCYPVLGMIKTVLLVVGSGRHVETVS